VGFSHDGLTLELMKNLAVGLVKQFVDLLAVCTVSRSLVVANRSQKMELSVLQLQVK
jgi:hypothetical protein